MRARYFALLPAFLLAVASATAQSLPERSPDGLLTTPRLQAVVEAQVARDRAALRGFLRADDPAVQARAALAQASVRDTASVPALLGLLNSGVPAVYTGAAFALAQMPPGAVPAERLLKTLRFERDESMRHLLVRALGSTGDKASMRALVRLRLPDDEAAAVALALARYGMRGVVGSASTAWLIGQLTSGDPWTRRNAAYAFGRVDTLAQGQADTLRSALGTYAPDDPAAMHLIRALGKAGGASDTGRLADWLRNAPDWRTRVEAARALAGLPDRPSVRAALIRGLSDDHPLVARAAAEALAGTDWSASNTDAVGVWLSAHPDRWRVVAPLLRGLARNGRGRRTLRTVERWRAEQPPVAYAAALPALAPLDTARADTLLGAALRSGDLRVAAGATEAVVDRWARTRPDGSQATFRRLSAAARRGDPALLYHAAPALADSAFASMGAADTLATTYRSLATPADLEGMTAVLDALGTLGGPAAARTLRGALDHPHPTVRQAAARGLTAATDTAVTAAPRPLPKTPPIDWAYLQELGPRPRLTLETNRGAVTIELSAEQAPQTVQAITRFARDGRYDGVPFHRVVPNFVVQGGDFARGDGFGGPDFFLRTEITRLGHRRGTIGMASAGRNTEGSQFFVPHSMQPHLDGSYTSFGTVVEGMDVVDRLRAHDTVEAARVEPTEAKPTEEK